MDVLTAGELLAVLVELAAMAVMFLKRVESAPKGHNCVSLLPSIAVQWKMLQSVEVSSRDGGRKEEEADRIGRCLDWDSSRSHAPL